jgi:integration host factor subunit alpha
MTLPKEHIRQSIENRLVIPRFECSRLIDSLMEIVKTTLANGEDVLSSGFGKFIVRKKGSRQGKNPAAGGDLVLDARRVATFKCSPKLTRLSRFSDFVAVSA